MKLVINKKFGGFSVSEAGCKRLAEMGNEMAKTELEERARMKPNDPLAILSRDSFLYNIGRDSPDLVRVVEELGPAASGGHAKLAVVEIPDGIEWEIDDYDGMEKVNEVHRSWE